MVTHDNPLAVLSLGTDHQVQFRSAKGRVRTAEITVQHGDVVYVTCPLGVAVEVGLKQMGFGMCECSYRL
jgi:hypothetical protein